MWRCSRVLVDGTFTLNHALQRAALSFFLKPSVKQEPPITYAREGRFQPYLTDPALRPLLTGDRGR